MAPEQLEGKEADARTDIFAFGTVLYEMLTGRKVFEGKSQASLIAVILEREPPPISTLQPLTPPVLECLVALRRILPAAGNQHMKLEGATKWLKRFHWPSGQDPIREG